MKYIMDGMVHYDGMILDEVVQADFLFNYLSY
jgi:hypothetical protein